MYIFYLKVSDSGAVTEGSTVITISGVLLFGTNVQLVGLSLEQYQKNYKIEISNNGVDYSNPTYYLLCNSDCEICELTSPPTITIKVTQLYFMKFYEKLCNKVVALCITNYHPRSGMLIYRKTFTTMAYNHFMC